MPISTSARSVTSATASASAPGTMGKIVTQLTVTNRLDEGRAARGDIPADAVRTVTLHNVLVDTGATTLCLPPDVIAQLGLDVLREDVLREDVLREDVLREDVLREAPVATATGLGRARIFQDAKIALLGREGTFACLELPGGTTPLLGVIPLEALGIELDVANQRLRLLPESDTETYLTIL